MRAANLVSLTINTCNVSERTNLFYQGLIPYIMNNKLMSRVGNGYVQWDDEWKMGEMSKGRLYPNYSNTIDSGLAWCIQELRRRATSQGAANVNSSATGQDSQYRWHEVANGAQAVNIEIFEPLCIGPLQPFFLRKPHEVNPMSALSNWSSCVPLIDSLSL